MLYSTIWLLEITKPVRFCGLLFRSSLRDDLIIWVSMSFDPSVRPSVRPSVHNEVEAGDLVISDPDRGR